MRDDDCIAFLQWCLPRLGMRWPGFRRVRRQVCKRLARRLRALGLRDLAAYRRRLQAEPGEWPMLDGLCRITISRFYRDQGVFRHLEGNVLPDLARRARARGDDRLRCWCAGCASGEEAYTLAILWRLGPASEFPGLALETVATDADAAVLGRARAGVFAAASLKDLPGGWRAAAFDKIGGGYAVRPAFRPGIAFRLQDIRRRRPAGCFDLVLCRNLAFTYFDEAVQRRILGAIAARLRPGGVLVVGAHERLPPGGGLRAEGTAAFYCKPGPP